MGVITHSLNKQIFFLLFLLLSVIQYTAQQQKNTLYFKNIIRVMMNVKEVKIIQL